MLAIEPQLSFAGCDIGAALRRLTGDLTAAGVDTPGRDARLLVAASLGCETADLLRFPDRRLTQGEGQALGKMACRRAAREPVARILGERAFYGRMFHVSPATLDPRPCSETVIEAALGIVAEEGWRDLPIRILDVGTGTGCLLLTLLAELPLATGLGTDIDPAALEIAAANAARLDLVTRSRFEMHNYFEGVRGVFDLLISNPPYVRTSDIRALEPEVCDYEPHTALDGGADGLAAYRTLASHCFVLVPNGWVMLEVGAGQASDVAAHLESGLRPGASARRWKDLGGHERCVAVRSQS